MWRTPKPVRFICLKYFDCGWKLGSRRAILCTTIKITRNTHNNDDPFTEPILKPPLATSSMSESPPPPKRDHSASPNYGTPPPLSGFWTPLTPPLTARRRRDETRTNVRADHYSSHKVQSACSLIQVPASLPLDQHLSPQFVNDQLTSSSHNFNCLQHSSTSMPYNQDLMMIRLFANKLPWSLQGALDSLLLEMWCPYGCI